ncbi:hypothetical protein KIK84_15500 [Curvibacter sp. CHRR-16]|uniref:energy transducer TonB n=1 Tax=Curvibacter sp. CHRR-16 TaxID=2835872 RepID=UPI001BDB0ECB|nr:hypothetical protein [Curvibacter sp. CHRR-16]MBT0571728.1 hypothetical protein [Curvibacter sp. CHRR-16]
MQHLLRISPLAATAALSLLLHAAVLVCVPSKLPMPIRAGTVSARYLQVQLQAIPHAAATSGLVPHTATPADTRKPAAAPPLQHDARTDSTPPLFVPNTALDTPLLPMSAPDTDMLRGQRFTGWPIAITLYINADGTVVDVVLQPHIPEDEAALQALRDMFFTTRYMPPHQHGVSVQAMLGLELSLDFL